MHSSWNGCTTSALETHFVLMIWMTLFISGQSASSSASAVHIAQLNQMGKNAYMYGRSRSRGPPSSQRAPIYTERTPPRGRQPAAQQLRFATYPQEQPLPQHYPAADAGSVQAPHYDQQHAGGYAPDPHPARRGVPDR